MEFISDFGAYSIHHLELLIVALTGFCLDVVQNWLVGVLATGLPVDSLVQSMLVSILACILSTSLTLGRAESPRLYCFQNCWEVLRSSWTFVVLWNPPSWPSNLSFEGQKSEISFKSRHLWAVFLLEVLHFLASSTF